MKKCDSLQKKCRIFYTPPPAATWEINANLRWPSSSKPTGNTATVAATYNALCTGTIRLVFRGETIASKTIDILPCSNLQTDNISAVLTKGSINHYSATATYTTSSIRVIGYEWSSSNSSWKILSNNSSSTSIEYRPTSILNSLPSSSVIKVRAQDGCGWSDWKTVGTVGSMPLQNSLDKEGIQSGGQTIVRSFYTVYPNPAKDNLTIQIDKAAYVRQIQNAPSSSSKLRLVPQNGISLISDGEDRIISAQPILTVPDPSFDVRLYTNQGVMKKQQKVKDGTVNFSLSGLPQGIYLLHIYVNGSGQPFSEQIVVQP